MAQIRIAIVDDELVSRNNIKQMLDGNTQYRIVADFPNGSAALEWLRSNSVDILLCDMQMPGMNGVELMRNIHIIDAYLPIIAISGFDDFNYVRGSLVNGAANYILKNELNREKLVQALEDVRIKYKIHPEERKMLHRKGYCISQRKKFTADHIRSLIQNSEIDFSEANLIPVAIGPDFKIQTDRNNRSYRRDICQALMDMLGQFLDQHQYLIYLTEEDHIVLMLSFLEERSLFVMMNTVNNLIHRLQRQAARMLDLTLTVISGDMSADLSAAVNMALKMNEMIDDRFYLGGNRVIAYAVAGKVNYTDGHIPESVWNQLTYELEGSMKELIDVVQEIYDLLKAENASRSGVLAVSERILDLIGQAGPTESGETENLLYELNQAEEFEQIRSIMLNFLNDKRRHREQTSLASYTAPVRQALTYMWDHFTEDISLESCSETIGISYSQMSREFKKEVGQSFITYLNQLRLHRAKSFLIRGEKSMKDIVSLSGFRNYNYFFKVFKQNEGMTPTEYIDNQNQKLASKK